MRQKVRGASGPELGVSTMSADAPPTPAVITEDQIRDLVTEADALASARAAFSAMATEGAVQQPPPMGYALPEDDVEIHVKGAALAGHSAMAVKMANGGYKNRERGLGPAGSGLVIVVDTKTGYPVAVLLENAYLTDMRTAAAGALASMLLCVDKAEANLDGHRKQPTLPVHSSHEQISSGSILLRTQRRRTRLSTCRLRSGSTALSHTPNTQHRIPATICPMPSQKRAVHAQPLPGLPQPTALVNQVCQGTAAA